MSNIVIYIMIFFSILGGIDSLLNNRFGLGEKFEEGVKAMGGLALTMLGIYCLSPVVANGLRPILSYLSKLTGADPSIFISSLLAPDMGGYTSAIEVAKNESIACFSGLILSSTIGATVSFTIPIAVNTLSKEDFTYFIEGILAGTVTLPIAGFLGGILIGIPMQELISNLIPVIVLSIVLIVCLIKIQDKVLSCFIWIGKLIVFISKIGLIVGILDFMLDIKIFSNMILFEEGLIVVGQVAIMLSGAYPLFHFLSKILNKYLTKLGKKVDMNEFSVLGIITVLANSVPMLAMYENMDEKGKIINGAFAVSAAFTFGGQLGFVSSISKKMITPFLISKLVAGISAILFSCFFIRINMKKREKVI